MKTTGTIAASLLPALLAGCLTSSQPERVDWNVECAAAALKALGGDAEVCGVSRRRLPELMEEISEMKKGERWPAIYLLGVSLTGDPERLAAALGKLKKEGVKVTWISAIEMPEEIAATLNGLLDARVFDSSLLEAVGESFCVDVDEFTPFLCHLHGETDVLARHFTSLKSHVTWAAFLYRAMSCLPR